MLTKIYSRIDQYIKKFQYLRIRQLGEYHQVPSTSSFFDIALTDFTEKLTLDMSEFNLDLRTMLTSNNGVRRWEYGMMLNGIKNWRELNVLDIGAGPSMLPIYLKQYHEAQVTVFDLPQPFTIDVSILNARFKKSAINFTTGDMRSLPFRNNSFDVVLSISAIEHLSHSSDHQVITPKDIFIEETQQVIREMYRVTNPGGWLYITSEAYLPGKVRSDNWAGKLFENEPYGAYPINIIYDIFVSTLRKLGAEFPYPIIYDQDLILRSTRYSSYRNRFMTVFNLFAQKPLRNSDNLYI